MLMEAPALAWLGSVPVCSLFGTLVILAVPRDWPKASLGLAYASIGSAAVFALKGLLSIAGSDEVFQVTFEVFDQEASLVFSTWRLGIVLAIQLVVIGITILLSTIKALRVNGEDLAQIACLAAAGGSISAMAGTQLLLVLGIILALGPIVLTMERLWRTRKKTLRFFDAAVVLTLLGGGAVTFISGNYWIGGMATALALFFAHPRISPAIGMTAELISALQTLAFEFVVFLVRQPFYLLRQIQQNRTTSNDKESS